MDLSTSDLGIDNPIITDATGRVVNKAPWAATPQVKLDVSAYQVSVY
ncbi:MAG: hypothetical protein IPN38_18975 [Flavobacteriales bacterium]|nr:hypothetical protein [Flavobacteriales bacterium]